MARARRQGASERTQETRLVDALGCEIEPTPTPPSVVERLKAASSRTKALVIGGAALLAFVTLALQNYGTAKAHFFPRDDGPSIRVFLAATEPNSDFELTRGGRSVLFVRVPMIQGPSDRLVFGTMMIRPMNVGSRSMNDLTLAVVYPPSLWNSAVAALDRAAVTPLQGKESIGYEVQRAGDRWSATWSLPRLDPLGGAPCPVSFYLQAGVSIESSHRAETASGEIEIRMFGPDWEGMQHVVDIRCIVADSDEFYSQSQAMAAAMRREGYPDVPYYLAETGGEGFSIPGGPTVVQARIAAFLGREDGSTLHDF